MQPEHLTQHELLAVLKQAKAESPRDYCLILMGYKHGLRSVELANLTLDDIKDGCVNIKRAKQSMETNQPMTAHRGEPLLDEIKALRRWLKARKDDGSKALFNSQMGGNMSREQIHRIYKGVATRAGIPAGKKRAVHVLKHSRASHLVGKMDLAELRQTMGHVNVQSTLIYAHVSDKAASKAAHAAEMEAFRR